MKVKNAFTVSMATEDQVVPCDYVGVESGRKVPDKFAKAGFGGQNLYGLNVRLKQGKRCGYSLSEN